MQFRSHIVLIINFFNMDKGGVCDKYIVSDEPNHVPSTPICRDNHKQGINIYVSQSHVVEVEIIADTTPFLVHYSGKFGVNVVHMSAF